jgi:uncharacterized protein (DUF2141 family)
MKKSILSHLFLLSVFIIISACAKINTPTGGPRDILPPVVVKSIPANGSKNFKGQKVEIFFDEYVVLDKIAEKFMVSPPLEKKPRVFIKSKSVVVEYDDKLKDSTTYTFYFMDAIKDLNEGNILDNYQFVFSTGPVLDSLSVTGNVYNSFTLDPTEKMRVQLYRNINDSAVIKTLPDYISRADVNGYFRINNVSPGKYRLYALNDEDNSKTYNRVEEEFAFMDSLLTITPQKNYIPVVKDTSKVKKATIKFHESSSQKQVAKKIPEPPVLTGEYQLYSFLAQKKAFYLTNSSRDLKYRLNYMLSLPPDSMKFQFSIPGIAENKYIIEENKLRDTIHVWLTDSTLYSEPQIMSVVKYPFTDTLGITRYKTDTIQMRFLMPRATRSAKIKKTFMKMENNIKGGTLRPGQSIVFTTQAPFSPPDTSRIRLYEIAETKKEGIPYELIKDSTNLEKYTLHAKLAEGKQYILIADSASFGDIYNENIDSTVFKFSVRTTDSYSKLTLNIQNCESDCIIQLLDKTEKLMGQLFINKDGKIVFPLLDPGTYRLRVIYDLNGDGRWTTGDFQTDRQPEPVSYYPAQIELKIGWDLVQDWNLGPRHFKEQKLRNKAKSSKN